MNKLVKGNLKTSLDCSEPLLRPFRLAVIILNTIDHLGKFHGKADEGFFIGENTPNIAGSGPNCLFDINALTKSMNYKPVVAGNQSNDNVGTKACDNAGKARIETEIMKRSSIGSSLPCGIEVNAVGAKTSIELPDDPNMPELEDIVYSDDDEDVGAKADMNNLNTFMLVSPILTTRIHKDHPVEQIIRGLDNISLKQEERQRIWKNMVCLVQFSKEQTIKIFKIACLLASYHKLNLRRWQKANRIEAIRLFLANASFKDFMVYQMDVKSAFLYGKIEEEVYVCQPPGFEDPDFPDRVYKVEKALYGLHQALRAWYDTLSTYLLDNGF
ncbi:putative ribonuclease H-like domain-containing protein [Tanacetum coccineum]